MHLHWEAPALCGATGHRKSTACVDERLHSIRDEIDATLTGIIIWVESASQQQRGYRTHRADSSRVNSQ